MNLRSDLYTKVVLTTIAALLAVLAFRPAAQPPSALANTDDPYLYVEPETTQIRDPNGSRNLQGKVIINLRNGDVWGFPTLTREPYPVDVSKNEGPVSRPIYLGRFDLGPVKNRR